VEELSILSQSPSLIWILRSLQTWTSGIFSVNLSPHFPKIIWVSGQNFVLAFCARYLILSQTLASWSKAKNTPSTALTAETILSLKSWSWKSSWELVFILAWWSLLTITRSSSPRPLQRLRHSICQGWIGLKTWNKDKKWLAF